MGYDFSDSVNVYHPYGTVDDVQVLLNQTHDAVGLGAECGVRSWDYQSWVRVDDVWKTKDVEV